MKFSKQYIKECDCKEIQDARPKKKFYFGDVVYWDFDPPEINIVEHLWAPDPKDLPKAIFIPTGDQLDDEIVKICKEKDYGYIFTFQIHEEKEVKLYAAYILASMFYFNEDNPLIAKIKLLKALLEAQ